MSGTDDPSALPGWLGGRSQLADAARWQALAEESAGSLSMMRATALRLRGEFAALDFGTTLRVLSALAQGSHVVARLVQADTEAVATMAAAGVEVPDDLLVIFPAEPGAVRASAMPGGGWFLDGLQTRTVHPGAVDRALVVAGTDEGDRLFLVRTDGPGVYRDHAPLSTIAPENPNGPVSFTAVPAAPVGTAAWWAGRPVTFDGMLRDVACWFGACVWLCRAIEATLQARTDSSDLQRVGRVDAWVFSARLAIRDAAVILEEDPSGLEAELAARRAAAVMATTVDTVVRLVALLSDPRVSHEDVLLPARVAQLQIVLRRFDADANLRALGGLVADGTASLAPPH